MKNLGIIVLFAALLTSCGKNYYDSNGEKHYLNSVNGSKIVVPSPLTSNNISNFYDLPQQNKNAQVGIAPPA